ncbi:Transcription accessory protein (S1 RNA-binding domain) [Hyphomicrobium sulfonivorans]|uniref:Small ribosomal subunit protein bS1 n=1 Tax=Hyphomicrobium sulfonivorans TaxID=121290 RepID=A0A120CY61_HYPSL|nr:Tex family protein [Hyphomicrobium sulfonivorans]KWT72030.1 Transcription accessory protein (S1 RNA-binding domain) [Hyphomicrobium sulfonivorans]
MDKINKRIAAELNVGANQVLAAVELLNEGATVPFIARYRKEKTGGLDDTQLRKLEERLGYLRELEDRRGTVLKTIEGLGKLTPELARQIDGVSTKIELEDLYAPYKPKRRTRAQIAREAGLEPLSDALLANPNLDPVAEAAKYINAEGGFADADTALEGARHILIERIAEKPEVVGTLREWMWGEGELKSAVRKGKSGEGEKFADYFAFGQRIQDMPSHRALAMLRGANEGVLDLDLDIAHEKDKPHPAEGRIKSTFGIAERGRPADAWLGETVRRAWNDKLSVSLQLGLLSRLKERADAEAITVFSRNLKDLLLAAPAGPRTTMGLDPGIRTGVKVAVVDATGKLLDTTTIYPHEPRRDWQGSLAALAMLCKKHRVEIISVGNGTGSRETDKLVAELIGKMPDLKIIKAIVSEAGASVYSASELAANEFPDLDVSLRGAVSIARRLQDPLAELVKIEPKAIGVGQYQHDVDQAGLARSLDAVVEDCVNSVGVDVNTASAPLLARVSGLNRTLASNIVAFRDENGAFKTRTALKKVPRLGAKAFEQAAGFLRIMDGKNPLDASAVHPEAYIVVEKIADVTKRPLKTMIGDRAFLKSVRPADFADEAFGIPTITDILAELEKPGRDPRPEFKTATFQDGVETIGDLEPGMQLEGVVTNVAAFGAFVDIGVHQDGLVHVSELADRFVKDPHEVVKAGDVVKVRVKEVDVARKRIGLTMRSGTVDRSASGRNDRQASLPSSQRSGAPIPRQSSPSQSGGESALAAALKRAQEKGQH